MRIFLFFSLIFSGLFANAQLNVSLEQCLEMARTQSPAAQSARYAMQANAYDYDAFKASFLPQLSLSADLPGLTRSITNITQDDGSILFIPQSQTFSTLSLNVSQRIHQTGGTVFAYSSLFNRLDLENTDNVFWQSSPFVVGLRQPIFQANRMKWDRKVQSLAFERAELRYSESIERIGRDIQDIYFDALIAQINFDIASKNVANNDTIYKISQGRYQVGKIAENELLQSELSYLNAQTAQASAQINQEQAKRRLKIALGLDMEQELILTAPRAFDFREVSPEDAVREATRHSSMLQSMRQTEIQAEQDLVFARQANRPTANLNATFGLNGTDETFNQAYQNLVDRQTFSVGVDVPILQWGGGKAQMQAAQARLKQARLDNQQFQKSFENDIRYQVLNIQLLKAQLQRAIQGDTIAQKRYDLTKNRYLVGKVDIQTLFIAQSEKDNARRSYITTLRSYWRALSELRINSLYDYNLGQPIRWTWN